jgi:hypothetical protein
MAIRGPMGFRVTLDRIVGHDGRATSALTGRVESDDGTIPGLLRAWAGALGVRF